MGAALVPQGSSAPVVRQNALSVVQDTSQAMLMAPANLRERLVACLVHLLRSTAKLMQAAICALEGTTQRIGAQILVWTAAMQLHWGLHTATVARRGSMASSLGAREAG